MKMSLISSTILYYGTYLATVGMSGVSVGRESSGPLRQSVVHWESGALGLNFLFGIHLLLDMVKSLYDSNPPTVFSSVKWRQKMGDIIHEVSLISRSLYEQDK